MMLSPIVLRNYDQSMSSLGNRFVLFLGYRSVSHKNCMSVWRNPSVHVSSWLERSLPRSRIVSKITLGLNNLLETGWSIFLHGGRR